MDYCCFGNPPLYCDLTWPVAKEVSSADTGLWQIQTGLCRAARKRTAFKSCVVKMSYFVLYSLTEMR